MYKQATFSMLSAAVHSVTSILHREGREFLELKRGFTGQKIANGEVFMIKRTNTWSADDISKEC